MASVKDFLARRWFVAAHLAICLVVMAIAGCTREPTPLENSITPTQFTAEKFQAVQVGEDWPGVMRRLGQPYGFIDIKEGRKRYTYSTPKDKTKRYAAYDVVVGPDNKVIDKSIIYLTEE
jgi:hypothetical protein